MLEEGLLAAIKLGRKLRISVGVGLLCGFIAMLWIQPETNGGIILVFAIFITVSILIGDIISLVFGKKDKPKDTK